MGVATCACVHLSLTLFSKFPGDW